MSEERPARVIGRLTALKIALTLAAIILFAVGIRTGEEIFRWAAIALLAIGFLLRFAGRRRRRDD